MKALTLAFSEDFFRQINALNEKFCWYKYKNNTDKINIYNVTIVKAQKVDFDLAWMHIFTTPVKTLATAKNRSPLKLIASRRLHVRYPVFLNIPVKNKINEVLFCQFITLNYFSAENFCKQKNRFAAVRFCSWQVDFLHR